MSARKPTHNVIVRKKVAGDKDEWVEVGVGWENESGSISLKFPPTTNIDREFLEHYSIMVSPRLKPST